MTHQRLTEDTPAGSVVTSSEQTSANNIIFGEYLHLQAHLLSDSPSLAVLQGLEGVVQCAWVCMLCLSFQLEPQDHKLILVLPCQSLFILQQ